MIGLFFCLAYLLHLGVRLIFALRALKAENGVAGVGEPISGTVVQPILSGDPGLSRSLEDNLLEFPEVRFLWLVDDDDLEAQSVTQALAPGYPEQVRVILCPRPPEGVNPKLFKLERAWREIETPALIVLDDDTRLPRRTLDTLLTSLSDAEVSTALPYYRCDGNVPTRLLAQFVNNTAALTYLPMLAFGPPLSINGMAYALRRDCLERCGGFEAVLRHLTDDLAVARHVRAHGGTIRQVSAPVQVETHVGSWSDYVRQMHRWFLFALLLIRSEPPGMQARLGLLLGLHPLLLWGALLTCLKGSVLAIAVFAATCVVRGIAPAWLQRRLTGRIRHQPALSLLSELLQPAHLLHAALSPNIRWRSRRYRVYANDRFESQ
jgi:ceramide glucosyltransferase